MERGGNRKEVPIQGVECSMKAVAGKDVTKAVILLDDSKKEEKGSLDHLSRMLELVVDKKGISNYLMMQKG